MTKYEWETELKRNIHRLPDDEIKRVMEFYGELFDDKAERGKSEREIIFEFGNPVDVADKILSEYEGELRSDEPAIMVTPPVQNSDSFDMGEERTERRQNITIEHTSVRKRSRNEESTHAQQASGSGGRKADMSRIVLFFVVNVLTCFAFFIVVGSVWIVLCSLTALGGVMGISGAGAAIISFGALFSGHAGAGLAQLGMGLALCGFGILMTVIMIKTVKLAAKLTVKTFKAIVNWLAPKGAKNA